MKHPPKWVGHALGVSAVVALTTSAGAQNELQLDLNSLAVHAVGGWNGLSHTGTLTFNADADSTLNTMLIDGVTQGSFVPGTLLDVQGSIDLLNGVVTGGMLHVELTSGASYDMAIPSGEGKVIALPGFPGPGPFGIVSLAISGFFNNLVGGTSYAGVDVSLWDNFEPLNGSFIVFKLGPDAVNGNDSNVDIDLFVIAEPGLRCKEHEPNDFCDTKNTFSTECEILQGILEKRLIPGPQPDTWLCVFDKAGAIIASDDNSGVIGNGKGAGLWSSDADNNGWADLLTDNGDGTYSLRMAVTGFPDGLDGNCDGFFQNGPHGQLGEFTLQVTYENAQGIEIRTDLYVDEFITGAEAFLINFTAPAGAASVHIDIDNMSGREEVCRDVDFICYNNLEPLVAYCITVIGGQDYNCEPTDTILGWFNKNCNLIFYDDDSGPAVGYSELCVVADVNGVITFAVSATGDFNFDGYIDGTEDTKFPVPHGLCGTYILKLRRTDGLPLIPPADPCATAVIEALQNGDVNADGIIDASDLTRLLSNWGLSTSTP